MSHISEITPGNVRDFDMESLQNPNSPPLEPTIAGCLKKYFTGAVKGLKGNIQVEEAARLTNGIAEYESHWPLFSVKPFRYPALPELPDQDVHCTANNTVRSACENMDYMRERFGERTFAAELFDVRSVRAVTWVAPIDYDFQLQLRGASGAGTFSIDFGLGYVDRDNEHKVPNYKELWRTGVDTAFTDGVFGARFIRTGSAIKGEDPVKSKAFEEFKMRHAIMPQRLLGIIGLYFMRELEPDYAVALSTEGARAYSTLGRSKGKCDYDGIFGDVGFQPIKDRNWLAIPEFGEGFYDAITQARVRHREERILRDTVESIQNMHTINPNDEHAVGRILFPVCSDDGKDVIEKEIGVAYDTRNFRR